MDKRNVQCFWKFYSHLISRKRQTFTTNFIITAAFLFYQSLLLPQFLHQVNKYCRGGSRTPRTSKIESFATIVNEFQPSAIVAMLLLQSQKLAGTLATPLCCFSTKNTFSALTLTLSRRIFLSYKNQSIDLPFKILVCFQYDRDLHHERVEGPYK